MKRLLAAPFLLLMLSHMSVPPLSAQEPVFQSEPLFQSLRFTFSTEPENYYILRRKDTLPMPPAPPVPFAGAVPARPDSLHGAPVGMKLGDGALQTLIDNNVLSAHDRAFYTLERVPANRTLDYDNDGIPDARELEYFLMDPLNPADAAQNFDGDGWSNHDEIMLFHTDPWSANTAATVPRLQGLSVDAARTMLENRGFILHTLNITRTVRQPGSAITTPDFTGPVPAGAAFTLTAAMPPDPGVANPANSLFIHPSIIGANGSAGTEAEAQAYYAAVDPLGQRTTLAAWKSANGFGSPGGTQAQAAYFNEADLGFGREMYLRRDGQRIAFYVTNYETANEAARKPRRDIATVAMEYSPHPVKGGDPYVKFFTFNGNHEQPELRGQPAQPPDARITSIDLDGRGNKFQPAMCMTCHGGTPRALVNGVYPDDGRVGARFIPFDVGSFSYPTVPGYSRASQEAAMKALNEAVLASIPDAKKFTKKQTSSIPDNDGTPAEQTLVVAGLTGVIDDLDLQFDGDLGGKPGIEHERLEQLTIALESPSGTLITVLEPDYIRPGRDFTQTRVDDEAATALSDSPDSKRFTGSWRGGRDQLRSFDGEDPNGTWTLRVYDKESDTVGLLLGWSLYITTTQPLADAPRDLIHGWYGGPSLSGAFNDNYTPPGWTTPESLSKGGDHLYRQVVAHSCRACHVMLTDTKPYADFDRYSEFADGGVPFIIKSFVFDQGRMPAAKRTYDKFWHSSQPSQPQVLAEWLARVSPDSAIVSSANVPQSLSSSGPPFNFIGLSSTAAVSVPFTSIRDVDVAIDSFTHQRPSDVEFTLIGPDGTQVGLFDIGGTVNGWAPGPFVPVSSILGMQSTYFDDESSILPDSHPVQAPFSGSWRPLNPLSAFDGKNPNGTWTLTARDTITGLNAGTLQGWTLHFNTLGRTHGPGRPIADFIMPPSPANGGTVNLSALGNPGGVFAWSFVQKPFLSNTALTSSSAQNTTFTPDAEGIYTVRLTVGTAPIQGVTEKSLLVQNRPPVVTIAPVPDVTLPASASISATVTDDMLGNFGQPPVLETFWEKVSGPGTVTFGDFMSLATTATFSAPGPYRLRLLADDNFLPGTIGEVTVNVLGSVPPPNTAPVVNAGADITVTPGSLPQSLTLTGSVTDDGNPAGSSVSSTWSVVGKPPGSTVSFTSPTTPATGASFSHPGSYILRLTATDGPLTTTDDVSVTLRVSFAGAIRPALVGCAVCHNDNSAAAGLSFGPSFNTLHPAGTIHTALMSPGSGRVNLTSHNQSKFLQYPASGSPSGAMGPQPNFGMGSTNFNNILLWIQQGAPNN